MCCYRSGSLIGSGLKMDSCQDPVSFNMIFSRLVDAKAARAAKCFLEETMFEPETGCLESYIECLFENELVEEAIDVFEQLKMAGHCVFVEHMEFGFVAVSQSKKHRRCVEIER
ncbi:Pentatricopeptide repeat-containing protein [Abeliophyllum distichum]|uniref:Pentatricopeptide repeat-containing protein n=1 Tax=Abeliophyllum distichum TaxID=126358 RepID=A0ABD1V228_9LAMI